MREEGKVQSSASPSKKKKKKERDRKTALFPKRTRKKKKKKKTGNRLYSPRSARKERGEKKGKKRVEFPSPGDFFLEKEKKKGKNPRPPPNGRSPRNGKRKKKKEGKRKERAPGAFPGARKRRGEKESKFFLFKTADGRKGGNNAGGFSGKIGRNRKWEKEEEKKVRGRLPNYQSAFDPHKKRKRDKCPWAANQHWGGERGKKK